MLGMVSVYPTLRQKGYWAKLTIYRQKSVDLTPNRSSVLRKNSVCDDRESVSGDRPSVDFDRQPGDGNPPLAFCDGNLATSGSPGILEI
ncbi:MAG: hypothetical protein KAW12_24530 [Candidatus Aminicenantes bacterium]|nr:hypothetical protein [Candidatus Aminicenantes bacterium]